MGEKAVSTYTYEAYLAVEAESELKYEFHDGMITAMAGGSPIHSQICGNTIRSAGNALIEAKKNCIVHTSDLRVRIESTNRSYYPDVSIVCDKPVYSEKDSHALINPILIVEVLSDTTADFDRSEKFAQYRKISSLREYVMISQNKALVDSYYRTKDGTWEIQTVAGLSGVVKLKSIDCEITMGDIYRLVPDFK